jgi:hypothetical protein
MGYIGYIPSYVRYHSGLSDKEKLLYCELTALADKNSFVKLNKEQLCKALGIKSEASISNYLKKLAKHNLIKVLGPDYISFDIEISDVIAAAPINEKESSSKSLAIAEELVEIWNTHWDTNIRVTKKLQAMVTSRMKSFTGEELVVATKNRIKKVEDDPWWSAGDGKKYRKNIALLLRDDDKVDECINYIGEKENPKPKSIDFATQVVPFKKERLIDRYKK